MDKVLGMIGLARRAGRIECGGEQTIAAVRTGKAKLVVIADDISQNSRKAITDCCRHYGVKYITYSVKDELGKAVGRSWCAAAAIMDPGFADAICKRAEEGFCVERKG